MSTTDTDPFPAMVDVIPEAEAGEYKVDHSIVDEKAAQAENLITALGNPHYDDEEITPGTYCRLINTKQRRMIMSDAPSERKTNYEIVEIAHGDVLIGGLGLGMIVCPLFGKAKVTSITVVELSPDIIKLVAAPLRRYLNKTYVEFAGLPRLRIAKRNIHDFKPPKGKLYDVIYFDIWDYPSVDAFEEMLELETRYQRWLKEGGVIKSWRKKAAQYDYAEYQSMEDVRDRIPIPKWVKQLQEKEKEDD